MELTVTGGLLRHEDLGSGLRCDVLQGVALLADDQANVLVVHFDKAMWVGEWICLSNVNLRLVYSSVLTNDGFNGFFS